MINLDGKVAIVTGSSRGIGRGIALQLAKHGAQVVVNYAGNAEKAQEVVREIKAQTGQDAVAMLFNVKNSAEVNSAVKDIADKFGRIDILVNNAGISKDGLLMRVKDEDVMQVLQINLCGAIYCARACLRPMLKNKSGRIINISSVVGEMGNAGQTIYAAAKAGLLGFSKSLAREMAKKNITVNTISPGYIETDMTAFMSPEIRAEMNRGIPMGMAGSTDDIAAAVLFLASDEARYITGQTLAVNGGMYM